MNKIVITCIKENPKGTIAKVGFFYVLKSKPSGTFIVDKAIVISQYNDMKKVTTDLFLETINGTPVHVVGNSYLSTDANNTTNDNLSELTECKS